MNIGRHLLNDIKPLGLTDKISDILDQMEELKFSQLAVVDDDQYYLGLIDEDDALEIENETGELGQHARYLKPYSIALGSNLFEAIKVIGEGQLSLLPVVDEDHIYKGYLSPLELMQDLGRQMTFVESGSVLVLEIPTRDYQLSQISQIIESDDARIIGFHLTASSSSDELYLALKINQKDLGRILKSLERYSYKVVEVFHESLFDDTLDDRYQALMKYLNI